MRASIICSSQTLLNANPLTGFTFNLFLGEIMQSILNAYKAPFDSTAASKTSPLVIAATWGISAFVVARLLP